MGRKSDRKGGSQSVSSYSESCTEMLPEIVEMEMALDGEDARDDENLSEPDTVKDTNYGDGNNLEFAVCSMQGWRPTMEDAHIIDLDLDVKDKMASLFAVFDGHGGDHVARICEKEFPRRLRKNKSLQRGDVSKALKECIEALDEEIVRGEYDVKSSVGATLLTTVVTDKMIYVAHVGDSRCVIGQKKSGHKSMTEDHVPTNWREKRRIEKAGGYVQDKRVNGSLAMSRAMGDAEFKRNRSRSPSRQAVVATPELATFPRDKADFMVMACDGIWEVMPNKKVIEFVRERLKKKRTLKSIAKELCDKCLAEEEDGDELGRDNMTVIIVEFKQKGSRKKGSDESSQSEGAAGKKFLASPSPPSVPPAKGQPRDKPVGSTGGGTADSDKPGRWTRFTSIFKSKKKSSSSSSSGDDKKKKDSDEDKENKDKKDDDKRDGKKKGKKSASSIIAVVNSDSSDSADSRGRTPGPKRGDRSESRTTTVSSTGMTSLTNDSSLRSFSTGTESSYLPRHKRSKYKNKKKKR